MTFWILLLASYGLCFGLMNDKAKRLTDLLKRIPLFPADGEYWVERMLKCPYCIGFHTGLDGVGYGRPSLSGGGGVLWKPLHGGEIAAFAFASSAFCYAMDTILQWFER